MSQKKNSVQPLEGAVAEKDAGGDVAQPMARGNWGGQIEFLLTMLGFAVGLGNVWRFPYQCFKNGGGAFVIAYFLMLLLLGLPLFFMECALGQFASLGPISIWVFNPLFKGLGFCMISATWIISLYYNIIISWCIYYFFASMTSHLPWAFCDQEWNTIACVTTDDMRMYRNNETLLNETLIDRGLNGTEDFKTASEEYFYIQVLKQSSDVGESGGLVWQLVLCQFLSWTIIFVVLIKGVQSLGKVMYFVTLFPYFMLLCLLIQNCQLPGAREGVMFYLKPDWSRMADAGMWSDAATQIFYNLGTCGGGLIALASYNKFKNNTIRDATIVPIINALTSLLAGFVVFTSLGFMAYQKDMLDDFDNVVKGGPGLTFILYPEAIVQMRGSTAWAVLFFLMMICLGFSSQFSFVETVFVAIMDEFPHLLRTSQARQVTFRGVMILFYFFLTFPMVTKAGYYYFHIVDTFASGFPLLIVGFFEFMALIWIYGHNRFLDDIEMMIGKRLPDLIFFLVCWLVISPVLLLVIVIFKGVQQRPLTLDDYVFPGWANALGWLIVAFCLIWFPIGIVYRLVKDKGNIKFSVTPGPGWGPTLPEDRTGRYAPPVSKEDPKGEAILDAPPPYTEMSKVTNPHEDPELAPARAHAI